MKDNRMDFLKANYHAHTWRCQHAYDTEREYIEAAISMGIEIFGFSDHVPCPYQDGYVSNIRMTMKQAPEYVETIRRLEAEYRDQIKIYAGFEAEYVPEFYEEQMRMFRNLGCDYMIMGQHFLGSEEKGPYTGTETEDESRIRRYVDLVIEGMKTGSYAYLAHPDLMNGFGIRLGDDPVVQRNEGTGHSVGDQHARHGRRGKALSGRAFLEDCRGSRK